MENPVRIMPCLDMQNGRVVKGVHCSISARSGSRS
jgi:imidazole glycerol phosphate synthase subunit HisF